MKLNFSNIQGIIVVALLFMAITSYAQDGMPSPTPNDTKDADYTLGDDRATLLEGGEAKSSTISAPAVKETTTTATAPKQTVKPKVAEAKTTEKEQPDPLSFNFLYALIQKFKFSDMVD